MSKASLCIEVPKNCGQKALALANKLGLSDKTLEIQRSEREIFIPLVRKPEENELATLREQVPDFRLTIKAFTEKKLEKKTLAEVLQNRVPPHLLAILPRALDMVGDIAIIEVPFELKTYENLIGEAVLKTHKNVRTVLAKASAVTGLYRLREFSVIAGENRTATVYKEYGCTYQVDLAKVYFSPRLSHEHKRVASLVQEGETVVDLFAGVGPFSVLIAKVGDVKVYAVDLNSAAIELLKRNCRLNRVENRVFPILGDAKQVVEDKLLGVADRVIMNLPERALEFVDTACKALKPAGGIVHHYEFIRQPDSIENMKHRFSEAVEKTGRKVDAFPFAKTIRETAPYEWQVALDAKIL
ncbi:MAG: class I SAM-dependent methyltransferase family protein [Candidatus Bathyarchaeota archaeon]|nr:class I SAM-dependent methyltransferase family protein [Candidatus Bathyarchaeota archaeon]